MAAAPLAYLNGRFLPVSEAGLSLNDAGFVFGATVTDLVRTFRQRLFRLDAHIERFQQSCRLCHILLMATEAELTATAGELIDRNAKVLGADDELALVMFATPGPIGIYLGDTEDGPPTLGMHSFRLPLERYRRLHEVGAHLIVPPVRANAAVDPRAKQRSRMHWWIARQAAQAVDPAADALLLDAEGFVTETASANIIAVRSGELLTPPAGSVLPGVSLQFVCELAIEMGLSFREQRLRLEDCLTADELLLTCTSWCLAGVSQLDGRGINWPGPMYQRFRDAWSKRVECVIT